MLLCAQKRENGHTQIATVKKQVQSKTAAPVLLKNLHSPNIC